MKLYLQVAPSDKTDLDLHLSGLIELPTSMLSALQNTLVAGMFDVIKKKRERERHCDETRVDLMVFATRVAICL